MTRGFDEDVEQRLFGLTQVAFSEVIAASLPAGLARFEAFLDRGHSVGLDDPGRHLCMLPTHAADGFSGANFINSAPSKFGRSCERGQTLKLTQTSPS
jgi:hypothetical protein